MNDAPTTENLWPLWDQITGLALVVERGGESFTLRVEPESVRKSIHLLPPMFQSAIERYLKGLLKS